MDALTCTDFLRTFVRRMAMRMKRGEMLPALASSAQLVALAITPPQLLVHFLLIRWPRCQKILEQGHCRCRCAMQTADRDGRSKMMPATLGRMAMRMKRRKGARAPIFSASELLGILPVTSCVQGGGPGP